MTTANLRQSLLVLLCVAGAAHADPLKVKIRSSAEAVCGRKIYFNLEEMGDVQVRDWQVYPEGTLGFDEHNGGLTADFSTEFPGTYVFIVSIAGMDGDHIVISSAKHVVKMTKSKLLDPAVTTEANESDMPAQPRAARKTGRVPATETIKRWIAEVQSQTKNNDRQLIAATLIQQAKLLENNTFQGGNILAESRAMSRVALGNQFAPWDTFFNKLDKMFTDFQQQGQLPTEKHFAGLLRNVAELLQQP